MKRGSITFGVRRHVPGCIAFAPGVITHFPRVSLWRRMRRWLREWMEGR